MSEVKCEHDWFDCSNERVLPPAKSCRKCGRTVGEDEERGMFVQWPWLPTLSSAAVAEREPDSDRSFLLRNAVTRVSELEAENARLRDERDKAVLRGWKAALDCVTYAAANSYGPRVDSKAVSEARDALVTELIIGSPGDYLDVEWKGAQDAVQAIARAEAAEARLAEALKALEPFAREAEHHRNEVGTVSIECGIDECRQSEYTIADLWAARRVREGGNVDG